VHLRSKEELYAAAQQAYYTKEEPIMTDLEFDKLENELRAGGSPAVNEVFGADNNDLSDKSASIRPVSNSEECLNWIRSNIGKELILTLKYDGVNVRVQAEGNKVYAHSRARGDSNALDFTPGIKYLIPHIDESCVVIGESFVDNSYLDVLKRKYDTAKYKSPRTAALTLLRVDHEKEDYDHLNFIAYDTTRAFDTREKMFIWLESRGFRIPLYQVLTVKEGDDAESLLEKAIEFVDDGSPADGCVLELNDLTEPYNFDGKYKTSQIALKYGKWGTSTYKGVVTGIEFTPKRGNMGTVLLIEPLVLPNGFTYRRINAFNIGIVLREGIGVGSVIEFEQKANSMCVLRYGGDNNGL
jgi:NAD-dependent DNA ligase